MTTTMKSREWAAVLVLAAAVASVGVVAASREGCAPAGDPQAGRPAAAGTSQGVKVAFDGGRAYEYVRQIVAFGPRPAGSNALQQTRDHIRKTLKSLGVESIEQPFDADTPVGRIHMANVIGRVPGASPERIIVAGHYDTKLFRQFRFVGANDGGSSAAFLLELARVLKGRQNRLTMELLFLDGEESTNPNDWDEPNNRYGSRHYVQAARADGSLKQVKAMILVDMVGDRDLEIKREAASSRWLTDLIWGAAKRLKHGDVFVDEETSIEDDHVPFLNAGVPAVDLIDLDFPPWHTSGDTLDKVAARSLQVVGDVVVASLPEIEKRVKQ